MQDPFTHARVLSPKKELADLRVQYFLLRKKYGAGLWNTTEGKALELYLDREDFYVRDDNYIFASPKTIATYWEVIDHLEFGEKHFLLVGEPGTGKEVIARIISNRLGKPLIAVNCATLVDSIADALLFGVSGKAGLAGVPKTGSIGFVESANGKVLFLDEFFDAHEKVLPKLLRLLQDPRGYHRVGEAAERLLDKDTIIVAASNRYPTLADVRMAVELGLLRGDLVERFQSQIELPPLRKRIKEIHHIADNILMRIREEKNSGQHELPRRLSESAKQILRFHSHDWPGNVRELTHFLTHQVRLQRWHGGSQELELTESELDWRQAEAMATTSDAPATKLGLSDTLSLTAWNDQELMKIKERQLIAYLHLTMLNEGRSEIDERWVADRCSVILQTKNASQRLKDAIGLGCKPIAKRVNELSRLGSSNSLGRQLTPG